MITISYLETPKTLHIFEVIVPPSVICKFSYILYFYKLILHTQLDFKTLFCIESVYFPQILVTKIQSHEQNTQNLFKNFHIILPVSGTAGHYFHILRTWFTYVVKTTRKEISFFCKPRLSGCYTNILFLIHSSNSSGSWWVITQENLQKCVTTTDHYSRWTTARFGPSKTRKTDMERSTLTRPGLTDWHWVPEMLLATTNPLIYLFYTEILVFSRLNQGWRGGGENFSSCAYSVVKSKQLKGYYHETRAA